MTPYHHDAGMTLYHSDVLDVLRQMPDESVQMCVTSPPYWALRDYGTPGQLGLESTPEEYVANMVAVFREVRRVLRDDGVVFLNLGDSYWNGGGEKRDGGHGFVDGGKPKLDAAKGMLLQKPSSTELGLKTKDMVGIPWRVAFALQADGWWLRSDIIWAKPNPMPESVTDRPTKAHEYLFLLTKQARYWYDAEAIAEPAEHRVWRPGRENAITAYPGSPNRYSDGPSGFPTNETGRNRRTVWTVATQPYVHAHFATFPEKLVEPCILAGSREGDTVLDPFVGSGTTALVARKHGRKAIGIDINADYLDMAIKRNAQQTLWFTEAAS